MGVIKNRDSRKDGKFLKRETMPQRLLRDTTDSEKVNNLSCQAEVLFYRLMMKADDFGCFHAKPSLIKAALYPLRLGTVRESDVSRWLAECEKAGLIAFYDADSKPFVVILKFGQRLRNMVKRFPSPPPDILMRIAADSDSPPEGNGSRIEVEKEVEGELRAREEILNFFRTDFQKYRPQEYAKFQRDYQEGVKKENLEARRDKIINDVIEGFWTHYAKQGWKTGGGVLITNKLEAFKNWMSKEKQFVK